MVARRNDSGPGNGADDGDDEVACPVTELADLLSGDPAELSDSELADATVALTRWRHRVDAACGGHVEALERRAVHRRDGAVSAPAWLAARTQVSKARCGTWLATARDLRDCPLTAAAYRDGLLGTKVVESMMRARVGLEARFAHDEEVLVEALGRLTVETARRAIWRWRQLALAQAGTSKDDRHPDDPALNSLAISSTFEGNRVLDGEFSPIVGAELEGLIEAEVTRLFHTGVFSSDDGLTPRQRNAQALLELVRRGSVVATEAGEQKRAATILADLRHLLGIPATTPDELIAWPCQLADGTVVSVSQMLAVLGDATINLVLGMFDLQDGATFRPIGEITSNRHANPFQRRMLRARDQGCVWPGCDRPARWSHAHHEPPWDDTHQTTLAQLVLLCPAHHTMRHRDGYQFLLEPDGTLTVLRPDGTPLPTAPPGHLIQAPSAKTPSAGTAPPAPRAPAGGSGRVTPRTPAQPAPTSTNRTRRSQRAREPNPTRASGDPDPPSAPGPST